MSSEPLQFEAEAMTVRAHIEARAKHPIAADKVFLMHRDRSWTYRQFRDESARVAQFLLQRLERDSGDPAPHVAMVLENHLELLGLFGGCAFAGLTLFGINTGLRGETLAGVIDQSRATILIVDERLVGEIQRLPALKHVSPENLLIVPTAGGDVPPERDYNACLDREVGPAGEAYEAPDVAVQPESNLMVIYTSGTTGLPKGINNNHFKLLATGVGVSSNMGLGQDDVGYACMPLFHSNAMFVGLMPAFWVGGSMGLRERFSASNFVSDVKRYGITYWNYVGEPVHYVLNAIEKEFDGDTERIRAEVADHPDNHMRYAVGNGAAPPDIDKLVEYMGLEDMFELYGSTEAAISTFRRLGDPRGSVGEVLDPAVKILDESGNECEPVALDTDGHILNYDRAVGEICRVSADSGLFQGYFDNSKASTDKFRDGVYHSGDLGHMLLHGDKRFLYFDGRTDDWIRKDGENFSALQVSRLISESPEIVLAAAYGVPCHVSDELVMAAIKMAPGVAFDPQSFFDYCDGQIEHGSMDRKWMPDFIRVVEDFEYTGTQKVLVRNLKKVHFDPARIGSDPLYTRERGDKTFRVFSARDYEEVRKRFEEAERLELLDR